MDEILVLVVLVHRCLHNVLYSLTNSFPATSDRLHCANLLPDDAALLLQALLVDLPVDFVDILDVGVVELNRSQPEIDVLICKCPTQLIHLALYL